MIWRKSRKFFFGQAISQFEGFLQVKGGVQPSLDGSCNARPFVLRCRIARQDAFGKCGPICGVA